MDCKTGAICAEQLRAVGLGFKAKKQHFGFLHELAWVQFVTAGRFGILADGACVIIEVLFTV